VGIACDVVAPLLIAKGAGDRVKTGKRDACRLVRLHRAGELTAVRVPSRDEEAVRDLVRARAAILADRKAGRQRLTAVLMRHGRTWRGPSSWTKAHRDWIGAQKFAGPALAAAVSCCRAALDTREAGLAAIGARLLPWASREPLAGPAARLMCYRGIAELTALTLAARVIGWRRFPAARAFTGLTGLCPAGYSSGGKTARGHITKAVRTALTGAAWSGRHPPATGAALRRRPQGASPDTLARSWKAQRRLHARYTRLVSHGKTPPEVVTAAARQLAGFTWAEMTSEVS
jgi:transposase